MQPRIISLIASSTEIVCALGYEDHLVGRSHECDYPESVLDRPQCSEPKFNIEGSSLDVDLRVKELVEEALSVYRVDADKLSALEPTLIVTQDHCKVCAVSLDDVNAAACAVIPSQPKIVSLAPDSLEDIYEGIHQIAVALNDQAAGAQLVGRMQDGFAEIESRLPDGQRPRVACLEWIDPIWTSGNWLP